MHEASAPAFLHRLMEDLRLQSVVLLSVVKCFHEAIRLATLTVASTLRFQISSSPIRPPCSASTGSACGEAPQSIVCRNRVVVSSVFSPSLWNPFYINSYLKLNQLLFINVGLVSHFLPKEFLKQTKYARIGLKFRLSKILKFLRILR